MLIALTFLAGNLGFFESKRLEQYLGTLRLRLSPCLASFVRILKCNVRAGNQTGITFASWRSLDISGATWRKFLNRSTAIPSISRWLLVMSCLVLSVLWRLSIDPWYIHPIRLRCSSHKTWQRWFFSWQSSTGTLQFNRSGGPSCSSIASWAIKRYGRGSYLTNGEE